MSDVPYVCVYMAMHTDGMVTTLELERGAWAACEQIADGEPDVGHLMPRKPVAAAYYLVRLAVE